EHDGFAVASCGVEVRGVQVAVGADVLAVIDHRAGARRAQILEAKPARRVLSEVQHPRVLVDSARGDGGTRLDDAYRGSTRVLDGRSFNLDDEVRLLRAIDE